MNFEEKIISIIKNNTEGKNKDVTISTDIRKDLGIDSFDSLMVITALEDEFSIYIPDTDFEGINTVSDIIRLLLEKYPDLGEKSYD
ncbi:MAG TPA: acyl carrier protein [Firmicutes bacterium]|nr:acyl carrier protein [Bacillota bacterium]